MNPIKVGVIGGGGIVDAHIRGYRAYADAIKVIAVADVVTETVQRRAAELDAVAYTDFRQMISEADLDAVDICLPHHLHADAIVAAAEAGKHILCEKPLCLTVQQAELVQRTVSAAGVTLMCAHNQLYLPAVAKAKQLLEQGVLGTVYEVRTTDSFYNDFDPQNMGWRATAATSGGGELMDTGYHPTYLMLHLAGGSPVEATALLSTAPAALHGGRGLGSGAGPLRQRCRWPAGDELGVRPAAEHREVLRCRRAWLAAQRWRIADPDPARIGQRDLRLRCRGHLCRRDRRSLRTACASGTRPLHTEKEGIDVLCLILAAYEGARTRTIAPVFRVSDTSAG